MPITVNGSHWAPFIRCHYFTWMGLDFHFQRIIVNQKLIFRHVFRFARCYLPQFILSFERKLLEISPNRSVIIQLLLSFSACVSDYHLMRFKSTVRWLTIHAEFMSILIFLFRMSYGDWSIIYCGFLSPQISHSLCFGSKIIQIHFRSFDKREFRFFFLNTVSSSC